MENDNNKRINITEEYILPFINEHKGLYKLISIIILVIIGFLAYQNIFDNTFHFDDSVWRTLDEVKEKDYEGLFEFSAFRIIPFATFTHNYHTFGNETAGYYYINLSIHIINSILVFFLLYMVMRTPVIKETRIAKYTPLIALFGALIYLTHPIQTQAVAYVYQRLASIAAMFYFLTCLMYLLARSRKTIFQKIIFYFLTLVALTGAVFSKENTFTLPVTIVFFEVFLLNRNIKINIGYVLSILLIVLILAGAAISLLGLDIIFMTQTNTYGDVITSENYLLTQFKVISKYWRLLFLPYGQHLDHYIVLSDNFFEINTFLGFLFNLAIIVIAILLYKKHRLLSFGIFWIYITLSIESSVIPIRDVMFEHRLYIPMFGFVLIVLNLLFMIFSKKYLDHLIIFLIALIALYSYLTYQRNRVWQNDGTLWTDTVRKSPENSRARNNRGLYFMKEEKFRLAIYDFTKAIELNSTYSEPYSNRGTAYFFRKNYYKALDDLNKCIEMDPDIAETYLNRSNIHMVLGDYKSAIKDLRILLRKDTSEYYAYLGLARSYRKMKNWNKAIDNYEEYVKRKKHDIPVFLNLSLCYQKIEKDEKALETLNEGIEKNPENARLHFRKAEILSSLDRHQEAVAEYLEVKRLQPNYPQLDKRLKRYKIEN